MFFKCVSGALPLFPKLLLVLCLYRVRNGLDSAVPSSFKMFSSLLEGKETSTFRFSFKP